MSVLPNTLGDIITKVRRITGRPSATQIADVDILKYINTFYVYDMPEHLKMESLRYNYQFTTTAGIPTYDLPTGTYLTGMPPVFIGGYQSYMTQSRQNYFRINPQLNMVQSSVYTGNGGLSAYTGQNLSNLPMIPGFKPNPPGAYVIWSATNDMAAAFLNWNVLVSAAGAPNATSGITPSYSLVDDGQGNLFATTQTSINPANRVGTVNYITGALSITNFLDDNNAPVAIPSGNAINAQYVPYVASRPQAVVFFQDQFILYPVPDQAYTVSFEAYKYPVSFALDGSGNVQYTLVPQLLEWWQMLAYGAADKIFADNGDLENMAKFRPLLEEQMNLCIRRSIVQQTSEQTTTIYTEISGYPGQYPFGGLGNGW